jgi:hypothetical protein
MNPAQPRRYAGAIFAAIVVCVIYAVTREPAAGDADASRFRFDRQPLLEAPHGPYKYVRRVHPSLERISAWISSVGASVALADIDGDGLPNDVCHVEPRTDQVIVAMVPGTAERRAPQYAPFVLSPQPARYDARTMAPMGCLVGDLNEDGFSDVVVYYAGRSPLAFLRRSEVAGNGLTSAAFRAVELVAGEERWYTNAGLLADVDGDGHADLVFGNYFQDGARILDAAGTGVESLHNTKSRASNGGLKHLLLWRDASDGTSSSVRYEQARDAFEENVTRGWTLAIGAADLDGDMFPELYFANDFGPDQLFHLDRSRSTPGHPRFALLRGQRSVTTPASFVLGHDSFKGMGVDFGDVNGDGVMDIYVSNIADAFAFNESHFLWLSTGPVGSMNQGIAPYVQASERLGLSRSGWGWDTRLADFDNDGELEAVQATGFIRGRVNRWPELQALGTGNDELMHNPGFWPAFRPGDDVSGHNRFAFFARSSSQRFTNIAPEIKVLDVATGQTGILGAEMISRGIAVGDVDGDGALDFAVANQWEPSFYYHNTSPNPGRSLVLHLVLPPRHSPRQPTSIYSLEKLFGVGGLGRPAIGAVVTATLPDGRRLVGQADGGSGHSGKRSPDVHFGLGDIGADAEVTVDIKWRGSTGAIHQERLNLKPGWYGVVLGSDEE